MKLRRIDSELVRRGLAKSRGAAAQMIEDGRVKLDGEVVLKPARQMDPAQAIVVEGKNHATVTDSTLTSASDRGGVMLYQSMSGDAADSDAAAEVSTLALTDVSLTCTRQAPAVYVTNTSSQVTLTRCELTAPGGLATADEDRWGASGSNGGTLALTMDATSSEGAITAGSSSTITVTSADGGAATGTTSGSVTVS